MRSGVTIQWSGIRSLFSALEFFFGLRWTVKNQPFVRATDQRNTPPTKAAALLRSDQPET
jgi:hypothetical protein